ncbi:hypothetical protein FRAHR75_710036 [Frankia sp. Hr75.2]|nr:hypothetical protein FRAHR75_710036 [Frankia sp. Hr75.2]
MHHLGRSPSCIYRHHPQIADIFPVGLSVACRVLSVFALSLHIGWLSLNELLVVAIFEIFAIAIVALQVRRPVRRCGLRRFR